MAVPKIKKYLLEFSLAFLIVVSVFFGLLTKTRIYIIETENWKIQGIGQDLTGLFLLLRSC